MRPVLFELHAPLVGVITFPAYFTLLTLGFGLALILTAREGARLGMDRERVIDTNLWMVVWGIIGARVLHLVADGHVHDYINWCVDPTKVVAIGANVDWCANAVMCGHDFLCNTVTHKCYPPRDCFAALEVWRGGLAYYGGFIFAVAFAFYYVRKHGMGWWRTADLASPGIMLGLVCGRLGCFLNGCCYGKPTSSFIGVVFPRGGDAWRQQFDAHLIQANANALPVHPTQLYESFACFVCFLITYYVVRPRRRAFGQVFAAMLILYGIGRSICEIWRDDDRGVLFGFLSTSQIISIPLFALGAWILWTTRPKQSTI